jgi:hypothetical protein
MSWIVKQVWLHARCDIKDGFSVCTLREEFTSSIKFDCGDEGVTVPDLSGPR